jgi:hypothetical protein
MSKQRTATLVLLGLAHGNRIAWSEWSLLGAEQVKIGHSFQFSVVVHTAGAFAKTDFWAQKDVDVGSASSRVAMKSLSRAPLVDWKAPLDFSPNGTNLGGCRNRRFQRKTHRCNPLQWNKVHRVGFARRAKTVSFEDHFGFTTKEHD